MRSEKFTCCLTWCFSLARKGPLLIVFFRLGGQTLAQIPQGGIKVSVSGGMAPTFSWTPDSAIGRLVVEEGDMELWSTETEGTNTYRSPIRYGVHPPDAIEPEPANPLVAGQTYKVSLFRWIDVQKDEFQLVGTQEF